MKLKQAIASVTLLSFAFSANATLVVVDPAKIAQDAANEVVNFSQYLTTEINTLNTYINSVTALARYGNPSTYTSQIPGITQVAQLANSGMQLMQDYKTVQSLINPQRYEATVASIMAAYQQPNFTGMTSAYGVTTSLNQGSVQFQSSQYAISQQIQYLITEIENQKQNYQNQLSAATTAMQGCTDQSGVQKYQTAINSLHAAIAELNAREAQLNAQAALLQQRNQAAQSVYGAVQRTQASAYFQQSAESSLNAAFGVSVPQGTNGVQLTDYGYPGDFTPDTASSNGIGNHDNQLIPYANGNTVASAALSANVAAQYDVQIGQTFQVTSATGQHYTLRYDDTAPEPGRIDVYAPSGNLGGNNFSQSAATVATLPEGVIN